jgi:hypothetical protein
MRRSKLLAGAIIVVGVVSGAISIYNQCRSGNAVDYIGIVALAAFVTFLFHNPKNSKSRQYFKANSPDVNTLSEFGKDDELK